MKKSAVIVFFLVVCFCGGQAFGMKLKQTIFTDEKRNNLFLQFEKTEDEKKKRKLLFDDGPWSGILKCDPVVDLRLGSCKTDALLAELKKLVKEGGGEKLACYGFQGATVLCDAAFRGCTKSIEYILSSWQLKKLLLNTHGNMAWQTPLFSALEEGKLDAAKLLVKEGVTYNLQELDKRLRAVWGSMEKNKLASEEEMEQIRLCFSKFKEWLLFEFLHCKTLLKRGTGDKLFDCKILCPDS